MALPLVLTADEAMAGELAAAARSWGRPEAELEELLMDLGTWECHAGTALAAAGQQRQQGAPNGAAASTAGVGMQHQPQDEAQEDKSGGDVRVAAASLLPLGSHLLQYTRLCGWRLTAAHMRHTLAQLTALAHAQQQGQSAGATCLRGADAGAAAVPGRVDAAANEGGNNGAAAAGEVTGSLKPHVEKGAAAAALWRGPSSPRIAFATRRPRPTTSTPERHAVLAVGATEAQQEPHGTSSDPTQPAHPVLLRRKRGVPQAAPMQKASAVDSDSGKGKATGGVQPSQPEAKAAACIPAPGGPVWQPLQPTQPHWLEAILVEFWLRRIPAGEDDAFARWSLPWVVAQAQVL